jgi:hypothetical protein
MVIRAVVPLGLGGAALAGSASSRWSEAELPRFAVRNAPFIQMPGVEVPERSLLHEVDSNSPLHWDGDTLYLFNNYSHPWRTHGPDLEHLADRTYVHLGEVNDRMPMWIEATWKDGDGTLYGAYYFEPHTICSSNDHLPTAPRIGWARSRDNGLNWEDLGFVIEANPCAIKCDTRSEWNAGGTGDFVFLPDRDKRFFYFYGTSYDPDFAQQGIFVARFPYADRASPSGKAMKWRDGGWTEPGLWGRLTPVFPAERDYHKKNGAMFWGPSIHWNTYLGLFVMILNHAKDTKLTNDGIFVSFNRDIGDPDGWSRPQLLLDRDAILEATTVGEVKDGRMVVPTGVYYGELRGSKSGRVIADTISSGWYPQIIGMGKGETDKLSGRTGRIFLTGMSRLDVTFFRPGEAVK